MTPGFFLVRPYKEGYVRNLWARYTDSGLQLGCRVVKAHAKVGVPVTNSCPRCEAPSVSIRAPQ